MTPTATPQFRFINQAGEELPMDDRMRAFGQRYAQQWAANHNGDAPELDHPFGRHADDLDFLITFEPLLSEIPARAGTPESIAQSLRRVHAYLESSPGDTRGPTRPR